MDKPWYLSKTVWGAIIVVVAAPIAVFSPAVAEFLKANDVGLAEEVVRGVAGAIEVVGAALAIYGRVKAWQTIR